MKFAAIACALLVSGASAAVSAPQSSQQSTQQSTQQVLDRCREDPLSLVDVPGRNSWAVECGYLTAAQAQFFDEEGEYLVFTSGCGHAGCSPYIPVSPVDACILGLTKFELCFTD